MRARHLCPAVALLAATACGTASGDQSLRVAQTPQGLSTGFLSPPPTATPSPAAPSATPTPSPPALPTAVPTRAAPVVTTPPADPRPTAVVVVVNDASKKVKGVVGDVDFVLPVGTQTRELTVHVDPGGNTGVLVQRADGPACTDAGPKYLKPDHHYAFTVKDLSGECQPGVRAIEGFLSESSG